MPTNIPYRPILSRILAAACLAAACAGDPADPVPPGTTPPPPPPPPPDPGPEPGASPRLVSWRLEVEGTRPLPLGVYDREVGTRCNFAVASDGVLRCLPLLVTDTNGWYADESCSPLLVWTPPVHAPGARPPALTAMAAAPGDTGCTPRRHEVRKTVPLPGQQRFFRRYGDGKCRLAPDDDRPRFPGGIFLTVGEVVAPSRFAAGKLATKKVGRCDRLALEQIQSDSGGAFPAGIHDTRWNRSCTLENDLRCWPEHVTIGEYYADGQCKTPIVGISACTDPVLARLDDLPRAIGPAWTGEVWWAPKKSCPAGPNALGATARALGEPLPDGVASVTCVPQGTGALKLNTAVSDTGGVLDQRGCDRGLAWSYTDATTGAKCRPARTPDGTIRCLPGAPIEPYFFSDAACTRPLVACDGDCRGDVVLAARGDDVVPGAAALRSVGPRFTGTQMFVSLYGSPCQAAPTAGSSLWELGPAAAWDRHPALGEWRGLERLGH